MGINCRINRRNRFRILQTTNRKKLQFDFGFARLSQTLKNERIPGNLKQQMPNNNLRTGLQHKLEPAQNLLTAATNNKLSGRAEPKQTRKPTSGPSPNKHKHIIAVAADRTSTETNRAEHDQPGVHYGHSSHAVS
jgi:hypothetical protein